MQANINVPVVLNAVEKVGKAFLSRYEKDEIPQNRKALLAVLEEMDQDCIESLKDSLSEDFPDTPWYIGDEFDTESQKRPEADSEYWLCDAMDGAIQYVQHLPGWTINLVLVRNGQGYFSTIYDPLAAEIYWAVENEGAFMNGKKMTPSIKTDTSVMVAVFEYGHQGTSENDGYKKTSETIHRLLENFGVVRNYGPHGLQIAKVANGRIDLFVQEDLDTYNWLAGIVIAKEAGLTILTSDGKPWEWGSESLLVASKEIANQFFKTQQ